MLAIGDSIIVGVGATTSKVHRQLLPRVTYVPVSFTAGPGRSSGDGFHPSESSYVAFGEAMADALHHRWIVRSSLTH